MKGLLAVMAKDRALHARRAPVADMRINSEGVAVSTTSCWLYPAAGYPAPAGAVVQLLTKGGIQCKGTWSDDGRFIAWAPNLQRDKALEERLGLS